MSVMLVMYHYVRDVEKTDHPGIFAISEADFQNQVEHLLRLHEPLDPQHLLDCVRNGSELPANAVLFTFDDGPVDHWERVQPVLEKHGIKAIFAPIGDPYVNGRVPFVQKNQYVRGRLGQDRIPDVFLERAEAIAPHAGVRQLIEEAPIPEYTAGTQKYLKYGHATIQTIPWSICVRVMDSLFSELVGEEEEFIAKEYLTCEHIVDLYKMGHAIASQTITHRSLLRLSPAEQREEIGSSMDWLEGLLGTKPLWLTYPYGDCDHESELAAVDLGIEIAYTAAPPLWSSLEQQYHVPRIDTRMLPTDVSAPMSEWSKALCPDMNQA